jgi:hypothetical protein
MRGLSISAAWEETRAILVRDGRLYISIGLALIALPSAINMLVNPRGGGATIGPLWVNVIAIVATLIGLAGQLALIRLALGPSITVGAAIAHGLRRMPFYLLAVVLLICALFVLAIPFGFVLAVVGVRVGGAGNAMQVSNSPVAVVLGLIYLAFLIFLAVRMIMSAPVASAESVGPFAILKRSWMLTEGHWWPLFGFLAMYIVGAVIVLMAVSSAVGVVVRLMIGAIEPMSAAALVFALIQSVVAAAVSGLFALMLARIYSQLAGGPEAERMGEVFR